MESNSIYNIFEAKLLGYKKMIYEINLYLQALNQSVFSQWNDKFPSMDSEQTEKYKNPLLEFLTKKCIDCIDDQIKYSLTSFIQLTSYDKLHQLNEEVIKRIQNFDKDFILIGVSDKNDLIFIHKNRVDVPIYLLKNLDDGQVQFLKIYNDSNCFIITLIELYKRGFYQNIDLFNNPQFNIKLEGELHRVFNSEADYWKKTKKVKKVNNNIIKEINLKDYIEKLKQQVSFELPDFKYEMEMNFQIGDIKINSKNHLFAYIYNLFKISDSTEEMIPFSSEHYIGTNADLLSYLDFVREEWNIGNDYYPILFNYSDSCLLVSCEDVSKPIFIYQNWREDIESLSIFADNSSQFLEANLEILTQAPQLFHQSKSKLNDLQEIQNIFKKHNPKSNWWSN